MKITVTMSTSAGDHVATFDVAPDAFVQSLRVDVPSGPLAVMPFTMHGHQLRFDQAQGHMHNDEPEDDSV